MIIILESALWQHPCHSPMTGSTSGSTSSHMTTPATAPATSRLSELPPGATAIVVQVMPRGTIDPVAMRLEDLGFVPGETLRIIAQGPMGGDPLVAQVGYTRFALRRAEAARILVTVIDPVATQAMGDA